MGCCCSSEKGCCGKPMYHGDARVDGKTVVITGGNNGIGKETAMELARRGARVIIASRNVQQSESVKQEIIDATGNNNVDCKKLDLASLASVRAFADDINKSEARLDILINNAGVAMIPYRATEDGFEMQMAVNYFGHFLLVNLLLDKLKASAPSRIVIVSSIGHKWGNINFDNLNSEKSYSEASAYCAAKLCNLLHMRELIKRLEGCNVSVNAVHPGAVETGLDKNMCITTNCCGRCLFAPIKACCYKTPVQGAQSSLTVALDPKYETRSGQYIVDCQEATASRKSFDEAVAKKLWEVTEELVKAKN